MSAVAVTTASANIISNLGGTNLKVGLRHLPTLPLPLPLKSARTKQLHCSSRTKLNLLRMRLLDAAAAGRIANANQAATGIGV